MPSGIHHVTSIASSARRNLDFYAGTLGLRLVKKTVNFDDPGSYHLYYGDAAGHPGTILTFFPWEGAPPGRLGIGEAQETVFSVPEGSIGYWTQRLIEKGVDPRSAGEALRRNHARVQGPRRDPARARGRQGRRGGRVGVERGRSAGGTRDSRLPQREPAAGRSRPDRRHPDRRFRLCRRRRRGRDATLSGAGRRARRHHRSEDGGRIPGGAPGRGLGSPHRVPGGRRRGASGDGRASSSRTIICARPSRRTATISARSISASPAGCCSKSRPIRPASPSTSRSSRSGRRSSCRHSSRRAAPRSKPRCRSSTSRGPKLAIPVSLRLSRKPVMAPALGYIHRFEPGARPDVFRRFSCSMERAATKPTSCRSAARSRPERRSSLRAGTCSKATCRASSGAFARACSTRTTCAAGRASSPISSPRRAAPMASAQPVALGYSNGANIAAAVLLLHPKTLAGAILLRATTPLAEPPRPDLSGVPVLILSGLNDPIIPRSGAEKLARALERGRGAGRTRRTARRPRPDPGRRRARQGVLSRGKRRSPPRASRLESCPARRRQRRRLQLPGDERDDFGHDGRSRLIHRRRHVGGVGRRDRRPQGENLVRHDPPAAERDDPCGDVDMDFLRLGVELEGADVEIDFVIRGRRRAVDPTGEPRVLETLASSRARKSAGSGSGQRGARQGWPASATRGPGCDRCRGRRSRSPGRHGTALGPRAPAAALRR